MFQEKEHVICGKYGVCKVDEIGPISASGISADKIFYTLVPIYDSKSRAYIPVDSKKVTMRPVISVQEANKLIDSMEDIEALQINDQKRREALFKEAMLKYDCKEWIKIIKSISLRKTQRVAEGKKVTMNDERYLQIAEDSLYGEFAVAFGINKGDVEQLISDRVK